MQTNSPGRCAGVATVAADVVVTDVRCCCPASQALEPWTCACAWPGRVDGINTAAGAMTPEMGWRRPIGRHSSRCYSFINYIFPKNIDGS